MNRKHSQQSQTFGIIVNADKSNKYTTQIGHLNHILDAFNACFIACICDEFNQMILSGGRLFHFIGIQGFILQISSAELCLLVECSHMKSFIKHASTFYNIFAAHIGMKSTHLFLHIHVVGCKRISPIL